MSIFRHIALALLLSVSAGAQAPGRAPITDRALPLNVHPASRTAATKDGFFAPTFAMSDDYFDGRDSRERVRRHLSVLKSAGVNTLRCAFSWNGLEPEQGKYDFAFWDMLVEEAAQAGVEVMPYIAYTPEWAAREKDQFWQHPPADFAAYAKLMKTVAARYRGRIRSWEIWNEPDLKEYWQGTPDEFAELVKLAAPAIREGNPDAVIVLGGMSMGPTEFFTRLIDVHHVERWVDVIAMHAYPESWDDERAESVYFQRAAAMRKMVAASGVDFWMNEIGYADYRFTRDKASLYGTSVHYGYEHTAAYQAEKLFKAHAMTVANQAASLTVWYRLDDFPHEDKRMPSDKVHSHLGVTDVKGNPKPALAAMRHVRTIFGKPVRVVDTEVRSDVRRGDSQAEVQVFERKDGSMVLIAWLRSSTREEVADRSGKAKDTRSETISVSVPCHAVPWMRESTATGTATNTGVAVGARRLQNMVLRGDRVKVVEFGCLRNSTEHRSSLDR